MLPFTFYYPAFWKEYPNVTFYNSSPRWSFQKFKHIPKILKACLKLFFVKASFSCRLPQKKNQQTAMLRARQFCNCLPEQPANQTSNWNDPNKKCQLVGCKLHFNTSPHSTACKKSVSYTSPKQTNLSRIPPRQPPVLPLISIGEIKPSTRLQAVTLKPVDAWKQQWAASLYTMPLLHATQLMNICRNGVVVPGVFGAGQVPFGGSQR